MATSTPAIRVFIVDDHALLRDSLKALLRPKPHIEVVGEAEGVEGLAEALQRTQPHVLLMDISLGQNKPDGLEGTRIARSVCPEVGVLVLTMFEDEEVLVEAARAGASGYLLKNSTPDELISAIEAVASGGGWLSPAVALKALEYLAGPAEGGPSEEARQEAAERLGLTERERQVLAMIVQGRKYQEIADALYVSTSQIKQVARSLCDKLGARDKAHAAAIAVAEGLVLPPKAQVPGANSA
ncbi:MAG: response regulator transcription factor [Armatimonadetes bacterium]|nr:response regulator transcription factor [Armatimonadota bacterium]